MLVTKLFCCLFKMGEVQLYSLQGISFINKLKCQSTFFPDVTLTGFGFELSFM